MLLYQHPQLPEEQTRLFKNIDSVPTVVAVYFREERVKNTLLRARGAYGGAYLA